MDSAQDITQDVIQVQSSNAGFDYLALPDAATHIRLIQVCKAETDLLQCEITTWPFASLPAYKAISYTWGDATSTETILLNNQLVTVRTNCEYALRQAYGHDGHKYVWIDSLCINQENKAEKSVQVAMMGQIYETAELVLACVGPHSGDSEYFMRLLRRNKRLHTSLARVDNGWYPNTDQCNTALTGSVLLWMIQRILFNFTRFRHAHNKFFARAYFTRIWVLQELFTAKNIIVCCGDSRAPLSDWQIRCVWPYFSISPVCVESERCIQDCPSW